MDLIFWVILDYYSYSPSIFLVFIQDVCVFLQGYEEKQMGYEGLGLDWLLYLYLFCIVYLMIDDDFFYFHLYFYIYTACSFSIRMCRLTLSNYCLTKVNDRNVLQTETAYIMVVKEVLMRTRAAPSGGTKYLCLLCRCQYALP